MKMGKHIQLSLFERSTFNITPDIKGAMNAAAKECGLSREEIVDKMNSLAERNGVCLVNGKRLTIDTLEKWLNPSESHRLISIKALPIFCAVVKDAGALNVLASPLDCMVISREDQRLLKWAKIKMRQKQDNRVLRRLESEL